MQNKLTKILFLKVTGEHDILNGLKITFIEQYIQVIIFYFRFSCEI